MYLDFRHFLGCLEESRSDAVKVAQCFVNEFDKFVIYAEYCTNYPRLDDHGIYMSMVFLTTLCAVIVTQSQFS